tara:strand:- start:1401 stop:2240 length:840 start_codon:yes stop_codon:yes gene_type:complete
MKNKILKIAIVGRTNAGKSTLINSIVGEKISIQNKKINTTIDTIIGIVNIKEIQLIFYDTPGSSFLKSSILESKKLKLNLWNGINEADIIIYLIDSKKININFLFDQLKKLNETRKKIFIIFNKIDIIEKKNILPFIDQISQTFKIESFFMISAKKNVGINYMLRNITKYSYSSKWLFDKNEITNKDDKFIINELLRETLLNFLHKEIPYNLDIKTSHYKILKNKNFKIKQKIYIPENRYKKIILGKKGEMIKRIRQETQKKISNLLKAKIHLYIEIIN